MNLFIKKIIDGLLKKTEALSTTLDTTGDEADPLQKKINSLLAKRDLMKSALNHATNPSDSATENLQNPAEKESLTESAPAEKTAAAPPKNTSNARKNNRPKRRGR